MSSPFVQKRTCAKLSKENLLSPNNAQKTQRHPKFLVLVTQLQNSDFFSRN